MKKKLFALMAVLCLSTLALVACAGRKDEDSSLDQETDGTAGNGTTTGTNGTNHTNDTNKTDNNDNTTNGTTGNGVNGNDAIGTDNTNLNTHTP